MSESTEPPRKLNIPELRAALWRAIALTLAEPMNAATRDHVIATAKVVEGMIELSSKLFQVEHIGGEE